LRSQYSVSHPNQPRWALPHFRSPRTLVGSNRWITDHPKSNRSKRAFAVSFRKLNHAIRSRGDPVNGYVTCLPYSCEAKQAALSPRRRIAALTKSDRISTVARLNRRIAIAFRKIGIRLLHVELDAQARRVPYLNESILHDRVGQSLQDVEPPFRLAVRQFARDVVLRQRGADLNQGGQSDQPIGRPVRRHQDSVQIGIFRDPFQLSEAADIPWIWPHGVDCMPLDELLEILPQVDLLAGMDRRGCGLSRIVYASMCDKLFDIDAKLNFVPQLSTGFEYTDPTHLILHLREGVTFQDGEKMDADAVKTSLMRHLTAKGSMRAGEINVIQAVEVVDPKKVQLVLKSPASQILAQLADRAGIIMSPKALAEGTNFGQHPVCVGPFAFAERVAQDRIVLKRDPNYWDAKNYHFDQVTYLPIPNSSIRLANLQAGSLDLVEFIAPADMATVEHRASPVPHARTSSSSARRQQDPSPDRPSPSAPWRELPRKRDERCPAGAQRRIAVDLGICLSTLVQMRNTTSDSQYRAGLYPPRKQVQEGQTVQTGR
jgi:Bacterial extracellular solute-binding proteins, family 5 Middle